MNVSRETPLEQVLDRLAGSRPLQALREEIPTGELFPSGEVLPEGSGLTLKGLTAPAVTLVLAALQHSGPESLLVICNHPGAGEMVYRQLYSLLGRGIYFLPANQPEEGAIPGFTTETEQYQAEAHNALLKRAALVKGAVLIKKAKLHKGNAHGKQSTVRKGTDLKEGSLTPREAPFQGKAVSRGKAASQGEAKILLVTSPRALDQRLGRTPQEGFILTRGARAPRQQVIEALPRWGYEQTEHTTTPKTFSRRGGILDVFLLYSARPLRVEFFGDRVESLRWFHPVSQRSLTTLERVEILPPPNISSDQGDYTYQTLVGDLKRILVTGEDPYHLSTREGIGTTLEVDCRSWRLQGLDSAGKNRLLSEALAGTERTLLFCDQDPLPAYLRDRVPAGSITVRRFLQGGFRSRSLGVCCLTPTELTGLAASGPTRWSLPGDGKQQRPISELATLNWGDYLVHLDYGIGLYRGLESGHGSKSERIKIEYADGALVYVPVQNLSKVHKYVGGGREKLSPARLGSGQWERQKRKVRSSASQVVAGLVEAYRSRSQPRGFRYNGDDEFLQALKASFPYLETPHQATAIQAVLDDMDRDLPLDRLIYGDVGFGKTEVALRAVMKAVASDRRALFLTPTTVLADQHYMTAVNRLEPLGVRVELLSRFRSKKEQERILGELRQGRVDLLVGTHRLLSSDVVVPRLGLVVVDEEHRFGVRQKESLRKLKAAVDVITLTATPIPRTLQQSLLGLRDLSKIETPPRERLPVRTVVKYLDWGLVTRAIEGELARGGQTYFIHNRVVDLPFYHQKITALFPRRSVAVAHGQMPSVQLEKTILAFFKGEIEILICTTIVEAGLDVTNANTILINAADHYGLAQIYQLRGRVGRSNRQAYCYLLLPPGKRLSPAARQRLKTIEYYSSLGCGYQVALKDLEIRGAGNLFGYRQSGHIATVGYEMYCRLLQEAVSEARGQDISPAFPQTTVNFSGEAFLPADYLTAAQDRIDFYQHLALLSNSQDLEAVREELRDRYGPLPAAAINLLALSGVRLALEFTPVSQVRIEPRRVTLTCSRPGGTPEQFLLQLRRWLSDRQLSGKIQPGKCDTLTVTIATQDLAQGLKLGEAFAGLFSGPIPV